MTPERLTAYVHLVVLKERAQAADCHTVCVPTAELELVLAEVQDVGEPQGQGTVDDDDDTDRGGSHARVAGAP